MDSPQKRWAIIGGVAVVLLVGYFLFSGGGNPEKDLAGTSQDKRLLAIEMLEKKDTPEAARVISQYMTDNDIQVARRSIFAMGAMTNSGSTQKLVEAMSHSREELREAAVVAMGMRGEKVDTSSLRERLQRDPSPVVRTAAAAQLGAMRDMESLPLLVQALDSDDRTLSNVAMRCLLDIGGREHAGFKPGATPQQRAEAIAALKRDWPTFKGINESYKKYKEVMRK